MLYASLHSCYGLPQATPYRKSAQGYEMQWATNYLGHFLLTQLLTPALQSTAAAVAKAAPDLTAEDRLGTQGLGSGRVVVVGSQLYKVGRINLGEAQLLNSPELYDPWAAYMQSKAALTLWMAELDKTLAATAAVAAAAVSSGGNGEEAAVVWRRAVAVAVHPGFCVQTGLTRSGSTYSCNPYG